MAVKNYYARYTLVSDNQYYIDYVDSMMNLENVDEKQKQRVKRKAYNFVSAMKKYLEWRNATITEILANGKDEIIFFENFLNDSKVKLANSSKKTLVRTIKDFFRYCGIDLEKTPKEKVVYFADDEIMQKHLKNDVKQAVTTQRAINRAINLYCEFRGMTPTELVEEVKEEEINSFELRNKLLEFYDWRKEQSDNASSNKDKTKKISSSFAWVQMTNVQYFYLYRANIQINVPKNRKPKDQKALDLPMGLGNNEQAKIITKETFRDKLLPLATLRESIAFMICFESGINPVDLCNITYKMFNDIIDGMKINHLNLKNPYDIPLEKIILLKHRRAKTSREFLLPISGRTLQLISLFLKARQDGKYGHADTITDDSCILSSEKFPYNKLNAVTISKMFKKCNEKAGIENYQPSDFRNSFISKMKTLTYEQVVKVIAGHELGLDSNYMVFDKEKETNLEKGIINVYLEYKKCWKKLFDLDNTEIIENRIREELREENKKMENTLIQLKMELEEIKEQRHADDTIQEERTEILERMDPAENLTKEELAILKTLMSKMRA